MVVFRGEKNNDVQQARGDVTEDPQLEVCIRLEDPKRSESSAWVRLVLAEISNSCVFVVSNPESSTVENGMPCLWANRPSAWKRMD